VLSSSMCAKPRDARSPELARTLLVLRFFSWLKISWFQELIFDIFYLF